MITKALFTQNWWVSLALVLAGLQVVFAIGIAADSDSGATEKLVVVSVWGTGAVLTVLGAQRRQRHRRGGDALIALGVVPAVVAGIIAYWFPPMWLIAAAGLLVMWSSILDAVAPADIAKMAT